MSRIRKRTAGLVALSVAAAAGAGSHTLARKPERTAVPAVAAPAPAADPETGTIRMEPETLELAQLRLEPAREEVLTERLEVTGTVEPDLSGVVRVTPRVSGKISAVRVNIGDTVAAGQVLAVLASAQLAEAQAEYEHSVHRLALAWKNLERQRQLAKLGAFGRPKVEEARARAAVVGGEASVAENELAAARTLLAEARSEQAALESEVAGAEAEVTRMRSDAAEAEAAVRSAQAALAQAQTGQRVAQSKFDRYQLLLKEELVSRQDWEQAQAEAQKAASDVESASASVSQAQARVGAARAAVAAAQSRVSAARSRVQQAGAKIEAAMARQAQAEARLTATRKSGEIAAEALSREEKVFRGAYLTSKEIVEAEEALHGAEHERDATATKVRLLGGVPGGGNNVTVTAPLPGRVTERTVTLGEMVAPEKALFTVVNLHSVWVQLHVYQKDLPRVRIGERVTITSDTAPGRRFTGSVSYIGDEVDEATRSVKVRCVLPNPGDVLRPSLFVRGVLIRPDPRPSLTVPQDAVQELGGQSVVFVPTGEPGEFFPRPVVAGARREGRVEIRSGLRAGERVVAANTFLVKAQTLKGAEAE